MNWQRFVHSEIGVDKSYVCGGHNALIMQTVREAIETNTLANWVRTTNYHLASGRQLTLAMFA
jgi:hypothetical protein